MSERRHKNQKPPRTLRLRTPEDLLAVVPYSLGFYPADSLVMISTGTESAFFARVDLPDEPDELPEVAEHLVDAAVQNRVRQVVAAVYTDDAALAVVAVEEFRLACAEAGIALVLAVRADGKRWFGMHRAGECAHPCPPEGTPYDVSSHALTAQAVLDGRVIQPSREALRETLIGRDTAEIEAVDAAAVDAAANRILGSLRTPLGEPVPDGVWQHLVREGHWVRHRVRRFLEDRVPLDADDAGRLLVAITSVHVRDVAWSEMSHANAKTHIELWRDLVRRSSVEYVAPAAALLGFAAWLSGDGALAWCAVERCQESDPDYSMAGLITHALTVALPPHAWSPMDHSMLPLFAG